MTNIHYTTLSSSTEIYVDRFRLPETSVAPCDARWSGALCDECGTRDATVRFVDTETHTCNACERCVPTASLPLALTFPVGVPSAEVYVARWQLPGSSVAPGDARWGGMRPAESATMLTLMVRLSSRAGGQS